MRYKFFLLNLRRGWRGLRHPPFFATLVWKRAAFTVTRRWVGASIRTPEGATLWNVQSLINYWGMFVLDELHGPWVDAVRESPGAVIIDVGSNVGLFRTLALDINPGCEVYTFDAWPGMAHYVPENRHRAIAIGEATGYQNLQLSGWGRGWTATTKPGIYTGAITRVPMQTLDSVLGIPLPVSVLKIDVDGAELEVLRGATEVIEQTHFILVETNKLDEVKELCPDRKWTTSNNQDWTGELV